MLGARNLLESRVGRAMRTLRGGDALVESLGINAFQLKLATFVLAACFGAVAGWLYAHLGRFVSPTPFDVHMSILFLMMAMVGGSTSLLGGIVGAALITLMKNSIQDYLPLIAPSTSGQLEIVVFSGLFILFLQRARNGIVPYVAQWLPEPKRAAPADADPCPAACSPSRGQALMQVEGAERRFGGLIAVNDVSFEVRTGEILGLIGPNGAGKSTMFNLITGALRPSGGRIRFAGKDITRARAASHRGRRNCAHLSARKAAPAHVAARTVLLGTYTRTRAGFFAGALRLDRAEERRAQYEAMKQLERVGLGDRPYELAGNLPLGNQRVLEIARALAADPDSSGPRRACRRASPAGETRACKSPALLARRRADNSSRRARHGVRHELGRPHRRDGFRLQALRGRSPRGTQRCTRAGSLSRRRHLMPLLAIENVSVCYGKAEAVRNVSLAVERGQIATLIGPNGAGKTSLLATAIGLLKSTGRILFDGADISRLPTEDRIEMGFCLVPERRELFAEMSVADNLLLGAYTRRSQPGAVRKSMDDVFDRFPRLRERRTQHAGTLSGGERQMLALGRALMAKPQLLMLDEPSLGLAPLIAREIFRILPSLRELGVSILLVEQNARAALETADFGYIMETGEIVHSGAAADLIHDPRLIATYLGGQETQLEHRRLRQSCLLQHAQEFAKPRSAIGRHVHAAVVQKAFAFPQTIAACAMLSCTIFGASKRLSFIASAK